MDEYDGDVRLVAACLQLAGQRSLAWRASSSSSVRLYDCQYWPVMPVELQIDLV